MNLKPQVNYLNFRFGKLNTPEFSHLKWLIFWPVFGILFYALELLRPMDDCYPMYHPIDDYIPFCEIFVIPYVFWFLYLFGMYAYTLFYDVDAFRRIMKFTAITYLATIVIYAIFPTRQDLRPMDFERDNFLTRFMADYYAFDTNTNVCPSLHVIGSAAVCFAGLHGKNFQTVCWKIWFAVSAVLISISTVFLKQHSILDIVYAIPLCLVAYFITYPPKKCKNNIE